MAKFLELLKMLGPKVSQLLPLILQFVSILTGDMSTTLDGLTAEMPEGFSASPECDECVACCVKGGMDEGAARALCANVQVKCEETAA